MRDFFVVCDRESLMRRKTIDTLKEMLGSRLEKQSKARNKPTHNSEIKITIFYVTLGT